MEFKLILAGGGGNGHEDFLKLLNQKIFEFAEYVGSVESIDAMNAIYTRHHIFIILSKFETFDLVYIDARSHRLPMLQSVGQGIDSYFINRSFAIPMKVNGKDEILFTLKKLLETYKEASQDSVAA
jgi:hypothetical protein